MFAEEVVGSYITCVLTVAATATIAFENQKTFLANLTVTCLCHSASTISPSSHCYTIDSADTWSCYSDIATDTPGLCYTIDSTKTVSSHSDIASNPPSHGYTIDYTGTFYHHSDTAISLPSLYNCYTSSLK